MDLTLDIASAVRPAAFAVAADASQLEGA